MDQFVSFYLTDLQSGCQESESWDISLNSLARPKSCGPNDEKQALTQVIFAKSPRPGHHMLSAMIELTISLSFSLRALTAFFRDTFAWAMTSSMSLGSRPVSSTSSPSSSSSSFLASVSGALPLSWAWS